jgi:hypothetical protein
MLASTARQFNKTVSKIVEEHFHLTKEMDRNLNYLWWMYYKGNNKDMIKPFMIVAEINLCFEMNIITDEEKDGMINMLSANDSDSLFILFSSLSFFRKERIKKLKEFLEENDSEVIDAYADVRSKYAYKILNIHSMNNMLITNNKK